MFFLRNLVERRSLLFQLVRRDFEQRFIGSAIGWVWGVIHPLVLLLSWTYIFEMVLKQPPPAGVKHYSLFIFAGMLPWMLFSDTVNRSASSLLEQANLITKTVFPSEIVPVSVFLSSLVSHLLALTLMVCAALAFNRQLSPFLLLLPFYMLLIGLFSIGIGWFVSSLQVFLRDTAQIVTVLLTFWFWLTPILVSEEQTPKWAHFLLVANPMFYGVRAYRDLLLSSRLPNPVDAAALAGSAILVFLLGGFFFRYMKRGFADVL
jgi:ABC-type polysaccharide/polyol phosphate export permease